MNICKFKASGFKYDKLNTTLDNWKISSMLFLFL